MGGDKRNPTWGEYIEKWPDHEREEIEAIRSAVEASAFRRSTAANFCNGHFFELSNGHTVRFTWRAWGDLIQAMEGKREGYLAYYI